jgi:hypothetical protein
LAERPNAPLVGRPRDASRQIKKWSLTSLRRSSVIAAKPKAPNRAISGGLYELDPTSGKKVAFWYCPEHAFGIMLPNGSVERPPTWEMKVKEASQ